MTVADAPRTAPHANDRSTYGWVSRAFHWSVALGIFALLPTGLVANRWAHRVEAGEVDLLARTATLFSIHKTIGVVLFALALGRIAWALTQPHPAPLHPERRLETLAAQTVHWMLYASLVLVPLTGWAAHAATEGFAPIWWPLGQNLPLVPESAAAEHLFGALHWVFTKVLAAALLLHVAGALKHALIDRDGTLARMARGWAPARLSPHDPGPAWAAPALAALLWGAAFAVGGVLGTRGEAVASAAGLEEVASEWAVEEGTLGLTIRQFGQEVTGAFEAWTAAIAFSEEADADGVHGDVRVEVDIASLTLGSVGQQAMGSDYFDVETHPVAVLTGDILADGGGHVLDGTLDLRGAEVPIRMPFELALDGDRATASGTVTLDRRDFGIGGGIPDEGTLAFGVDVAVDLVAVRGRE